MNKLLLLALLGLGLGGGAWKAQHPDGTLEDLKADALATFDRVKGGATAGVKAMINQPESAARQENLAEKLNNVELSLADNDAKLWDSLEEIKSTLNQDIQTSINDVEATALRATAGTEAGIVRLNTIEKRLELLVRRLDEQTTDDQIESFGNSLQALESSLAEATDANTSNTASAESDRINLSEQIDTLSLRLDTLAASQLAAAPSVSTAADSDEPDTTDNVADSTAVSATSLAALSLGIDERLSSIEDRLSTVNSDSRRIASLSQQLENAQQKIAELEQQDSNTQEQLTGLNNSVGELKTAGESLSIDTVQAEIQQQLAMLESQVEATENEDNAAELEAVLDTTRGRIQTLEQRVQELPASSAAADEALQTQTELEEQVANLTLQLQELSNTDPALESTVQDVKEQVEQLSARGFVTQEELQAQQASEPIEYKIYFDRNSTDITDDAAKVLNSFIAQEKNRTTGVSIYGFTDRLGSAAYNQQLALQRATNVRSFLITNGLDFTKIKALNGLGEDAAAAVLPDNASDAQQRVVVLYAEQP